MSFLKVAHFEKLIFGRNKNLTKIQKLYAKAKCYNYRRFSGKGPKTPDFQFFAVNEELEAQIEKETPIPGSVHYNKFLAMKALSICLQSSLEKLRNVIIVLEPIKSTSEGAYPYLASLYELDCLMAKDNDVELLLRADAVYEAVVKRGFPIFSEIEIFGGVRGVPTFKDLHDRILCRLFPKLLTCQDDALMLKYVLPALKAFFNTNVSDDEMKIVKDDIVFELYPHALCLIQTNHFAQLDHLCSVLMFQLMKAGRSEILDAQTQSKIDEAKAMVSLWYAQWALSVITCSRLWLKTPDSALESPIRTEMHRFEELVEPGIEIYENQFPVDIVKSDKEWDKVVKNGQLWFQRAMDYFGKVKIQSNDIKKEIIIPVILENFIKNALNKPDFSKFQKKKIKISYTFCLLYFSIQIISFAFFFHMFL